MKFLLDLHTHTLASGHAYNTIREMAQTAAEKGLELLGITEHAMQMPGTCVEFYFENMRMIDRRMCGIELMLGTELNIIDYEGTVDMSEHTLKGMDIAIASMHTPCLKPGSIKENTRSYQKVMRNPYVDIIGHPDDTRYPVDYRALIEAARENNKIIEINNNSLDPRCSRQGGWESNRIILELCKEYRQLVVVNSDAHIDTLIGSHAYAKQLMDEVDFPEELVLNGSVETLKKHLHKNFD